MLLAQLDVDNPVDDPESEAVAECKPAIDRLGEPSPETADQPATVPWRVPDDQPVPARREDGSA